LALKCGFDFLFNIFFFLIDAPDDLIRFLFGDIPLNPLIDLIFEFFLFLLHLECFHLFGLILTFHFFPDGALSFLWLFFLFGEEFLLAGEDFLHFFLEVEVLVALDGLVILDSL
jgi:hypothetical protein